MPSRDRSPRPALIALTVLAVTLLIASSAPPLAAATSSPPANQPHWRVLSRTDASVRLEVRIPGFGEQNAHPGRRVLPGAQPRRRRHPGSRRNARPAGDGTPGGRAARRADLRPGRLFRGARIDRRPLAARPAASLRDPGAGSIGLRPRRLDRGRDRCRSRSDRHGRRAPPRRRRRSHRPGRTTGDHGRPGRGSRDRGAGGSRSGVPADGGHEPRGDRAALRRVRGSARPPQPPPYRGAGRRRRPGRGGPRPRRPARRGPADQSPGTWALVCRTATVLAHLQPLLDWRRRQGYHVELDPPSSRPAAGIKAAAAGPLRRPRPPPLEFVVLVGDSDGTYGVPTWYETLSGYNGEGDHYYTTLDGDDILADVHVGRLSFARLAHTRHASSPRSSPTRQLRPWTTPTGSAGPACMGDPSDSGITTVYVNQWLKGQLLALG